MRELYHDECVAACAAFAAELIADGVEAKHSEGMNAVYAQGVHICAIMRDAPGHTDSYGNNPRAQAVCSGNAPICWQANLGLRWVISDNPHDVLKTATMHRAIQKEWRDTQDRAAAIRIALLDAEKDAMRAIEQANEFMSALRSGAGVAAMEVALQALAGRNGSETP